MNILPISIFGPISYYAYFKEGAIIESHENYQKRSIRNRFRILTANGMITLSIPLAKGKTNTIISKVKLSHDNPWYKTMIKTIRTAYNTAPYYEYYEHHLTQLLSPKYEFLIELYESIHEFLEKHLSLSNIDYTNNYHKIVDNMTDYRHIYQYNQSLDAYPQTFEDRYGFVSDLSILDLLFNMGPESVIYLNKMTSSNS